MGKTVAEIARERGEASIDCLADLVAEEHNQIVAIAFAMCEEDVAMVLAHELATVGSDTLALVSSEESEEALTHPRAYGTFPRVLGRYVREKGLLRLEEAVRKMTSLPAQRLGLPNRGMISENLAADLVVFNADTVIDTATYKRPCQYPEGIVHVIVNGQIVVEDGEHTGLQPGRVLSPPRLCH